MAKKRVAIFGWSLYDFANTIFSMNVISLYFALWVTVDNAAEDILYSIALSGSLVLAAILEPLFGIISDIQKRRMPFLVFFTSLSCLFTAALGVAKGLFLGLVIFCFANLFYQVAAVFYNALLVKICRRDEIGRVSGIGTGLGYLGAIAGLLLTRPFVLKYGHQGAFIPTALLFLVFSLPCFLLVRENGPDETGPGCLEVNIGRVFARIKETFADSKKYPGLLQFLFAAFIFLNAVNTVIVFMSVYVKKVAGFNDRDLIAIFLISTFTAMLGSFSFGAITDRIGPKKALVISLVLWFTGLVLAGLAQSKILFWMIGPVVGIAMGSVWTASRTLAIRLCPEEKLGEIFGLLGVVGKSSAIAGPVIWGLSILAFGFLGIIKYRIAILIQSTFVILGWLAIRSLPESDERLRRAERGRSLS